MDNQPEKLFLFWSRSAGRFARLRSVLSGGGWTVLVVQSATSLLQLEVSTNKLCCLAILDPIEDFSRHELTEITKFIDKGNSALISISANDHDDSSLATNINDLTRLYGVEFNEDCVIRPNPYKLYHPKEAMLEDFVANRGLGDVLSRHINHEPSEDSLSRPQAGPIKFGPRIIYPHGCTLKVLIPNDGGGSIRKSIIMMTSSQWALPGGQPICAFYRDEKSRSSVILFGSAQLLSDDYLNKEDNKSLLNCFLDFISSNLKSFPINISDARTIEIAESNMTADINRLAQEPIGCLQELDPLPEKKSQLIDVRLFSLDNSKLPLVIDAYGELGVPYEPLTLMRPMFEWSSLETNCEGNNLKYLLKKSSDS